MTSVCRWVRLEQSNLLLKSILLQGETKPATLTLQVTRVPAVTVYDVKAGIAAASVPGHRAHAEAMQANGTIAVEATLIDACSEACPEHHARQRLPSQACRWL